MLGKCSRSGKPVSQDAIRNSPRSFECECPAFPRSFECECPAKFQFDSELGVIFKGDRNDLCIELMDTEFRTKGSIMKILQSPEK